MRTGKKGQTPSYDGVTRLHDTVILGAASPIPGIYLKQVRLDSRCRGNDKIR